MSKRILFEVFLSFSSCCIPTFLHSGDSQGDSQSTYPNRIQSAELLAKFTTLTDEKQYVLFSPEKKIETFKTAITIANTFIDREELLAKKTLINKKLPAARTQEKELREKKIVEWTQKRQILEIKLFLEQNSLLTHQLKDSTLPYEKLAECCESKRKTMDSLSRLNDAVENLDAVENNISMEILSAVYTILAEIPLLEAFEAQLHAQNTRYQTNIHVLQENTAKTVRNYEEQHTILTNKLIVEQQKNLISTITLDTLNEERQTHNKEFLELQNQLAEARTEAQQKQHTIIQKYEKQIVTLSDELILERNKTVAEQAENNNLLIQLSTLQINLETEKTKFNTDILALKNYHNELTLEQQKYQELVIKYVKQGVALKTTLAQLERLNTQSEMVQSQHS